MQDIFPNQKHSMLCRKLLQIPDETQRHCTKEDVQSTPLIYLEECVAATPGTRQARGHSTFGIWMPLTCLLGSCREAQRRARDGLAGEGSQRPGALHRREEGTRARTGRGLPASEL